MELLNKQIETLQKMIDTSNYIVFFGGAGVSTESGIKDFRGKNGLYKQNNTKRPPEYLLSHTCLVKEPEAFFQYYRENMNSLNAKPNVTHTFLANLESCGKLKAVITQNIDGLHQKAGSKRVLELHGTTLRNYCINCGKEYEKDYIFNGKGIPKCECGGLIRPDVVLYEEMLPDSFLEAIIEIEKADLLIVAGTSLTVEPASSLVRYFRGRNLVIINETETPYDHYAELVIHNSLKEIFSKLKSSN